METRTNNAIWNDDLFALIQENDLKQSLSCYFRLREKKLPKEIHIIMDKEWKNQEEYYEFLSAVTVVSEDGTYEDENLKTFLNDSFDIPTLCSHPIVVFD